MGTLRFDHLGVVVEDLEAVSAFFAALGFEREGRSSVEGEVVDRINGLDGIRNDVQMMRTPDGTGKLELIKYHEPADPDGPSRFPPNRLGYRHICLEIGDVDATVERVRADGFEPVGEVQQWEDSWRLVYLRGPEGLIIELAERLSAS